MASSANHISLFILLILLSSLQIHARDNQFFSKVSTIPNNVVPDNKQPQNNQQQQQQEPNFLPQNENTYGLYSQDSRQLHPSSTTATTTTTASSSERYLPKNYNPVAYVTEPEDISETDSFTKERSFNSKPVTNNNYYSGEQNYYNNQQEQETEYRRYRPTNRNSDNYYYNGGSSFNSDPQGFTGARFSGGASAVSSRDKYFKNDGFQPQGMSDTRLLENGKYFYDVNNEKYSSDHPYERLKGARARNEYNNRNYYGNNENSYEFNGENSMGGYQNEEFQDEENYNLP